MSVAGIVLGTRLVLDLKGACSSRGCITRRYFWAVVRSRSTLVVELLMAKTVARFS